MAHVKASLLVLAVVSFIGAAVVWPEVLPVSVSILALMALYIQVLEAFR